MREIEAEVARIGRRMVKCSVGCRGIECNPRKARIRRRMAGGMDAARCEKSFTGVQPLRLVKLSWHRFTESLRHRRAMETVQKGPILLHHAAGQVVATPEDQDRFVMAFRQAVSACQDPLAAKRFGEQLQTQFLPTLYEWCRANRERLSACYVPFRSPTSCLKVFVVANSATFDFQLSDAIADLELRLEDMRWPCDILQVNADRPEELQAFFDPKESLQVFDGNRDTTPRES